MEALYDSEPEEYIYGLKKQRTDDAEDESLLSFLQEKVPSDIRNMIRDMVVEKRSIELQPLDTPLMNRYRGLRFSARHGRGLKIPELFYYGPGHIPEVVLPAVDKSSLSRVYEIAQFGRKFPVFKAYRRRKFSELVTLVEVCYMKNDKYYWTVVKLQDDDELLLPFRLVYQIVEANIE